MVASNLMLIPGAGEGQTGSGEESASPAGETRPRFSGAPGTNTKHNNKQPRGLCGLRGCLPEAARARTPDSRSFLCFLPLPMDAKEEV